MPQKSPQSKHKRSSRSKCPVRGLDSTTDDLFSGSYNMTYIKTIGSGYTSTVIKCKLFGDSSHSDLTAAAKIMDKGGVKRKYFQNEVDLLRRGDNINIVEFIMALETIDSYVIVTEYCGQGDLHDKLKTLDNSHVMAREYMIGVLNGLESLHNRLIAHLDIKMRNILISDKNIPKLADFGFAMKMRSKDSTLDFCNGTKDYWAPEMLDADPCYNPFMADIYALGVTFVGVCIKKPVKKKHDNIFMIMQNFQDRNQKMLFKGMLSTGCKSRWTFDMIKSSSWLYECLSPPPSPIPTLDEECI